MGQLWEFPVTPLTTQAVARLRTAIPRRRPQNAIGIDVSFCDGHVELDAATFVMLGEGVSEVHIPLTDRQKTAACVLVSIAAFYHDLWEIECGIKEHANVRLRPEYEVLDLRFKEDARRKLNIEVYGYYYEGMNGGLAVYF
jgi:prepilin-type processing-associated H-X9-DG protein